MTAPTWCVRLTAPAEAAPQIEAALAGLGGAVASGVPDADRMVTVNAYVEAEPVRAEVTAVLAAAALAAGIEVPEFQIERLPDLDWVAESHKALPPIQAGPFYVYGAHVASAPPTDSILLLVEASAAFGTGHHETTRACLMALADLKTTHAVGRALDMGCGTGILALAAAKLWRCPVVAVDNDPEAVRLTRENAAANEVAALVDAHLGDGYACPAVAAAAPYDLIVANILAGPLKDMAPHLIRNLAPGGVALLSGLLIDQACEVADAHRPLRVLGDASIGGWTVQTLGR